MNRYYNGTIVETNGLRQIAGGGTGASTSSQALTNLGAAPIASPAFTGNATFAGDLTASGTVYSTTPTPGDNSTKAATTAFVQAALASFSVSGSVILNTVLSGLSLATSTAVTAADSILVALGKLQAQVSSVATALGTLQTQFSSTAPLNSPAFTGTPTAPTPQSLDNSTKLATTSFVVNGAQNASGGSFPATNGVMSSGDTIAVALAKAQTQINARISSDGTVISVVQLTQAAYNALATKNSTTLYIIVG